MKYRRMILKISIKKHFRYVAQRHERLQLLSIHYLVVQKRVNLVDLENAENSLKEAFVAKSASIQLRTDLQRFGKPNPDPTLGQVNILEYM